ncbi:MAG: N-acyl homoserine lactonase family protein [Dehalococcoidia bacterium]
MAVANPTALTGPLPGGQQGASVKLHPLLCAEMLVPPEFIAATGGTVKLIRAMFGSRENWWRLPIPVYLLEHPGAGLILVDTGFHPSVAVDPKQNLGPVLGRLYSGAIEMKPEQAVAAQLRARGIDPGDVAVVIMTHLHVDHASGISEFTKPTYVLGEGEWEAFHKQGVRKGYVKKHLDVAVDFREVPYGGSATSSYSTFGRSFDLFGDGSVRLVATPGHASGHQSVILRLKDREALLAGDAALLLRTLDDERRGYAMADEHQWRRSLREIQLYRRENPNALIIPGHDAETWATLRESY